jgi:hypothetical protein
MFPFVNVCRRRTLYVPFWAARDVFLLNYRSVYHPQVVLIDHFLIQCSKPMIDSTSSCPLSVSRYSTLGGISLNACLSNIPPF